MITRSFLRCEMWLKIWLYLDICRFRPVSFSQNRGSRVGRGGRGPGGRWRWSELAEQNCRLFVLKFLVRMVQSGFPLLMRGQMTLNCTRSRESFYDRRGLKWANGQARFTEHHLGDLSLQTASPVKLFLGLDIWCNTFKIVVLQCWIEDHKIMFPGGQKMKASRSGTLVYSSRDRHDFPSYILKN